MACILVQKVWRVGKEGEFRSMAKWRLSPEEKVAVIGVNKEHVSRCEAFALEDPQCASALQIAECTRRTIRVHPRALRRCAKTERSVASKGSFEEYRNRAAASADRVMIMRPGACSCAPPGRRCYSALGRNIGKLQFRDADDGEFARVGADAGRRAGGDRRNSADAGECQMKYRYRSIQRGMQRQCVCLLKNIVYTAR